MISYCLSLHLKTLITTMDSFACWYCQTVVLSVWICRDGKKDISKWNVKIRTMVQFYVLGIRIETSKKITRNGILEWAVLYQRWNISFYFKTWHYTTDLREACQNCSVFFRLHNTSYIICIAIISCSHIRYCAYYVGQKHNWAIFLSHEVKWINNAIMWLFTLIYKIKLPTFNINISLEFVPSHIQWLWWSKSVLHVLIQIIIVCLFWSELCLKANIDRKIIWRAVFNIFISSLHSFKPI